MAPISMDLVASPALVHPFTKGFTAATWTLAAITLCLGVWAQFWAWYSKHEDWRRADREKKTSGNLAREIDTLKARIDAIGEDLRDAARLAARVPGLEKTIVELPGNFERVDKNQRNLETRLADLPKRYCNQKELEPLIEADKTLAEDLASAKESIAALQDTVKNLTLNKCNCGKDKLKTTQSIGSPLVRTMSAAKVDKKPAWNAYAGKSK
ncbi:hypothetical protein BGZ61DRAFT_542348 [Ilyonectria robusta]|uniref:uncharacterized protein n=1 Tax=Ilyonectria robusta TaxID=1079257 RepID=UPI001E8DD685|nr:uncharacterized protein BGZ61DRAFT_542348 [Ilyonectria robusta]KAH8649004.1 hypothetical protein BGZ61DRAFT_542348 [Ilyonectria robusta]